MRKQIAGRIIPPDAVSKKHLIQRLLEDLAIIRDDNESLLDFIETEFGDQDDCWKESSLKELRTALRPLLKTLDGARLLTLYQRYFTELDEYGWDDGLNAAIQMYPGRSLAR